MTLPVSISGLENKRLKTDIIAQSDVDLLQLLEESLSYLGLKNLNKGLA